MISCPLCQSGSRTLFLPGTSKQSHVQRDEYNCSSSDFGVHGDIYKCLSCDLQYADDGLSKNKISTLYSQVKDETYLDQEPARIATFSRHIKRLNLLARPGKVLDVGAYTGLFLHLAQKCGWQVFGLEPSRWAVDIAHKKYSISIKRSTLQKNLYPKQFFNAVTLWDVIEHFPDPVSAINICYQLLSPGGIIAISTMDVDSKAAQILGGSWPWYMRMHRVYFSKKTIKSLLEEAGFEKVVFYPHIRILTFSYFSSKLSKLFPQIAFFTNFISSIPILKKVLIPFFIGDLFDVYARKKTS